MSAANSSDTSPLLSISGLTVRFGGLTAISALDLAVHPGRIFALVGPNGAGKTTLLNCVSGFVRPDAGEITFAGTRLTGLGVDRRAALGIARTFQNLQLFASMTVLDNLMLAQHTKLHTGLGRALLAFGPWSASRAEETAAREQAYWALGELGITEYASALAGTLPFGIQQLVGIARAFVLRPKLVLLDEPAAGMLPAEVERLAGNLRRWRDDLGTTLVLIEHNMRLVQAAADDALVLDYGRKLAEGAPATVLNHPDVMAAYLGTGLRTAPASTTAVDGTGKAHEKGEADVAG